MGKYKGFDDCVAKNQDKSDPRAYCGEIKKKVEQEMGKELILLKSVGSVGNTKVDSNGLRLEGVALAEGDYNGLYYTSEELRKVGDGLAGKMMTINHGKKLQDIVGFFETSHYDKGIKFNALVDTQWVANLMRKYRGEIGISLELYVKKVNNPQMKRLEARKLDIVRGSLVLDPACPTEKCPVVPMENQMALAETLHDFTAKLASRCESQYMNKARTRYMAGWEGCIQAKRSCRGFDKRHAEIMCGFIMRRRTGQAGARNPYE